MGHHYNPSNSAFRWRDAWDTYDDPDLRGANCYRLPEPESLGEDERMPQQRLHEGARFWDTEEQYLITVVDVRTKIYTGTVGPRGAEGNDSVFYETDWTPPRRGGGFTESYHPHRDGEPISIGVEAFAERVASGELVPHRGNGIRPPP